MNLSVLIKINLDFAPKKYPKMTVYFPCIEEGKKKTYFGTLEFPEAFRKKVGG